MARKPRKKAAPSVHAEIPAGELARRARDLVARDELDEAEPLLHAALERLLGKRSIDVDDALVLAIDAARELSSRLHERALAALAAGRHATAEPLARRALEALVVASPVHQAFLNDRGLGKAQEAAEEAGAPDHLDQASVQLTLARSLRGLGPTHATEAARELKAAIDASASEEATRLAAARASIELGQLLVELGRPGEAGPCFRRAVVLAERVHGGTSSELIPFLEELVRFALSRNDEKEANRLLERARRIAAAASAGGPATAWPPVAPSTPEGAALAERVARGELARDRLELAAFAGHEPARDALGGGSPFKLLLAAPPDWFTARTTVTPDLLDLEVWVSSAWRWPAELAARFALAAAELAAPVWRRVKPESSAHDRAIEAARAFLAAPGEEHRAPLQKAGEACVADALLLAPGFKRAGNYQGACSGAFLAETCHSVLDAGRPFAGAAAVVQEAALELAWSPAEKRRTPPLTVKARDTLRATLLALAVRFALEEPPIR